MTFKKTHLYLFAFIAGITITGLVTKSSPKTKMETPKIGYEHQALEINQTVGNSLYLFETKTPQFTVSLAQQNQQGTLPTRPPLKGETRLTNTIPATKIQITRQDGTIETGLVGGNSFIKPIHAQDKKSISVKGVVANVDISYQTTPEGIKEKVILHNKNAPNEYLFDLETTNIEIKKDVFDGLWYFISTKTQKPLFYIPAPFAIDANGIKTSLVEIKKVIKNNQEYFKLVLDKDWILDQDRAFPIVIDPSFEVPENKTELAHQRNLTSKTYQEAGQNQFTWKGAMGPIHYQNERNNWEEIDTTLKHSPDPNFQFAVLDNDVKVYFAQSALGKPFLKLKNKNSTMEVSLVNPPTLNQPDQPPTIENNTITYPQVLKDVDFRYIVTVDSFLEEFVVQNPQAALKAFEIVQKLKVPNAFFQENQDGSIEFLDLNTHQQLWYIPPPKLYEIIQKNLRPKTISESYGVKYNIKQVSTDTFTIQKVLQEKGKNWLLDTKRTYPLVVDTTFSGSVGATCDNACTDGNDTVCVCNKAIGNGHYRIYIGRYYSTNHRAGFRFLNVTIARYALISSAILTVHSSANTTTNINTKVYCEDSSGSVTFVASSSCPYGRTLTTANTVWNIGTAAWSYGFSYNTPNFKDAAIEVVHRSDWDSGDPLTVLVVNNGTAEWLSRGVLAYLSGTGDGSHLTIIYTIKPTINYTPGAGSAIFKNVILKNMKSM